LSTKKPPFSKVRGKKRDKGQDLRGCKVDFSNQKNSEKLFETIGAKHSLIGKEPRSRGLSRQKCAELGGGGEGTPRMPTEEIH